MPLYPLTLYCGEAQAIRPHRSCNMSVRKASLCTPDDAVVAFPIAVQRRILALRVRRGTGEPTVEFIGARHHCASIFQCRAIYLAVAFTTSSLNR
jgi:hypothetical protein